MSKWVILNGGGSKRTTPGEWICRECGMSASNSEQGFRCHKCRKKYCELCIGEHREYCLPGTIGGQMTPDKRRTKHVLVQDDDGHWYVIPEDKRSAFGEWLNSEDAYNGLAPEWAVSVNGHPSRVVFGGYEIK